MIIDGDGMVLGRLASLVAHKALLGETVEIVNCEKVIVSGSRQHILANYKHKLDRGGPLHGPYFPKQSHMIVKRTIRGMLPYRQEKGFTALKRVKCYLGIPKELEGKESSKLEMADKSRLQTKRYLTLGEVSKLLGA